jgi:hypothetical protein
MIENVKIISTKNVLFCREKSMKGTLKMKPTGNYVGNKIFVNVRTANVGE